MIETNFDKGGKKILSFYTRNSWNIYQSYLTNVLLRWNTFIICKISGETCDGTSQTPEFCCFESTCGRLQLFHKKLIIDTKMNLKCVFDDKINWFDARKAAKHTTRLLKYLLLTRQSYILAGAHYKKNNCNQTCLFYYEKHILGSFEYLLSIFYEKVEVFSTEPRVTSTFYIASTAC